jgi:hypothetical protein
LVDYLFRTRNNVVHSGKCKYRDDGNIEYNVDYGKAHEFFLATEYVMEWISTIDAIIAEQLRSF